MKKGFTLVELLIVLILISILFVLLFRTYNKITEISFRIEQEKVLSQEMVYISQVLQNYSDRNTIDYERYENEEKLLDLQEKKGRTDILYLTGEDGSIGIYTTGTCISRNSVFAESISEDDIMTKIKESQKEGCWFELDMGGKKIALTNIRNSFFTKAIFRIIPYASEQQVLNDAGLCDTNYFACLHSDGFWLFTTAYIPNYSLFWSNRIKSDIQYFFNL